MAADDDVNDHAVDYSEDAENSDNRLSHHTVIHIDTHAMGCVAVLFSENHKQNQTSISMGGQGGGEGPLLQYHPQLSLPFSFIEFC